MLVRILIRILSAFLGAMGVVAVVFAAIYFNRISALGITITGPSSRRYEAKMVIDAVVAAVLLSLSCLLYASGRPGAE